MRLGLGVISLLTLASAALTISTCSVKQLRDAFTTPPSDKLVMVSCGGNVMVDATLDVPDGLILNVTGKLTLVATGYFSVLNLQGSAFISGLTVQGGKGTDGGCITTSASTSSSMTKLNITMMDVTFVSCLASGMGGGLFIQSNVVAILSRLKFWNCSAADRGGGLAIASGVASVECDACEFRNNFANGLGGGAVFLQDTSASFSQALFMQNQATGTNSSGGAVYSLSSTFDCLGCWFVSNSAKGLAGGFYADGTTASNATMTGEVSFTNTNFLNNTGSGRGSAIFACVHTEDLISVLFGALCDNQLDQPDSGSVGSSIHVDCTGNVELESVAFAGNLPDVNDPFTSSAVTHRSIRYLDINSVASQDLCDSQQNLTYMFAPTPAQPTGHLSGATSATVAHIRVSFIFLVFMVWL